MPFQICDMMSLIVKSFFPKISSRVPEFLGKAHGVPRASFEIEALVLRLFLSVVSRGRLREVWVVTERNTQAWSSPPDL